MIRKAGSGSNYLAAAITLIFGLIYLFMPGFMPYHSDAVSLKWHEVGTEMQVLILALMRATSGGYVVTAVAIIFLQFKFSRERIAWIPLLILLLGVISGLANLYATLLVRLNTPGNAPVFAPVAGLILITAGYILNRKGLKNN